MIDDSKDLDQEFDNNEEDELGQHEEGLYALGDEGASFMAYSVCLTP